MSNMDNDSKIAKILKDLPKADWKEKSKIADALNAYIGKQSFESPFKDLLHTCFSLLSEFRHETKRKPVEEYAILISDILDHGYPKLASFLFSNFYPRIKTMSEDSISRIIPTVKDAELWLKGAGVDKKELAERVTRDPASYYNFILFDWACKAVPIAAAMPLVRQVLLNEERQEYLPDSGQLLANLLIRDKNGALSREVLSATAKSREDMQRLLAAISGLPPVWGVWCCAFADYLIKPNEPQDDAECLAAIEEYFSKPDKHGAYFAAHFPPHLLTTMSISEQFRKVDDDERINKVIERLINISLKSPISDKHQVWVAGPVTAITGVLMEGESAITLHGVRQVAQGLRALESNPESAEVFRAVAMNLGIVEIGKRGEIVEYDPLDHEDVDGGILPGETVRVRCSGWSYENNIVLRAQVENNYREGKCIDQQ